MTWLQHQCTYTIKKINYLARAVLNQYCHNNCYSCSVIHHYGPIIPFACKWLKTTERHNNNTELVSIYPATIVCPKNLNYFCLKKASQ